MDRFLKTAPREVVLHILTSCGLSASDLASLNLTCTYFQHPANLNANRFLSITEVAAQHLCARERAYDALDKEGLDKLRWMLEGSWCRLLRYLSDVSMPRRHGQFSVSAGTSYSLAVDSLGRVYSWGEGTSGHLGHGDGATKCQPTEIAGLRGRRAAFICAGFGHSVVLCEDGLVFTFGDNSALLGFCGFKDGDVIWTPKCVEGFKGHDIVQVMVGSMGGTYQNVAVTRSGLLQAISPPDCDTGMIGEAVPSEYDVQTCLGMMINEQTDEPRGLPSYDGNRTLQISAGDGAGYMLGSTSKHCGHVCQFNGHSLEPVDFAWPIKEIAGGNGHCLALTEDGRAFSWNNANDGVSRRVVPHQVEFPEGVKIAHVAAGNNVSFFVDTRGRLYSSGNCQFSGLGYDTSSDCQACREQRPDSQASEHHTFLKPRLVEALLGEKVVQVSSQVNCIDCSHTLVVTETGKVYTFGQNDEGQLGHPPSTTPQPIPKPIPNFSLLV